MNKSAAIVAVALIALTGCGPDAAQVAAARRARLNTILAQSPVGDLATAERDQALIDTMTPLEQEAVRDQRNGIALTAAERHALAQTTDEQRHAYAQMAATLKWARAWRAQQDRESRYTAAAPSAAQQWLGLLGGTGPQPVYNWALVNPVNPLGWPGVGGGAVHLGGGPPAFPTSGTRTTTCMPLPGEISCATY
jgi:hypothetical protein